MRKQSTFGQLVVLIAAVVIFGCSDSGTTPSVPEPRQAPKRPSRDVQLDCQISAYACAKLDTAIQILEGDDNPDCAGLGTTARARFNSTTAGYRTGTDPDPKVVGYVAMYSTGSGPYGWTPQDGLVYIDPIHLIDNGFGSASSWVQWVGHEEYHQHGWPPAHSYPLGPPPPPCPLLWNTYPH